MVKKLTDQKMYSKSINKDLLYVWTQVRTKIGSLIIEQFSESVLIAGSFGNPHGRDLDIFVVFQTGKIKTILNFFHEFNTSIIKPFRNSEILLVPFRYFSSKVFLKYLNTGEDKSLTILPIHTLVFPDINSLLEWEDHEIIKHILIDLQNENQIWIGKDKLNFINSLLKPVDVHKRKKTYEELLFAAIQEATFNVLPGLEEVAIEKASYALRYLAEDDALNKKGYSPDSKAAIIQYLKSQDYIGSEFLAANKIFTKGVDETIADLFEYWRPSPAKKEHHKIKRLKEIQKFCVNLKSPILIFDELKIKENLETIARAFSILETRVEISYAIKANSIIPLIQYISSLLYGGLCATSYSDLVTLRKINIDPEKVNAHLNFPSEELLIETINKKYCIIISEEVTPSKILELRDKNLIDTNNLSVFIRVKSEIANRVGYHRFGINEKQIAYVFSLLRENDIFVKGLAIHSHAASYDPVLWAKSLYTLKRIISNQWKDYFKYNPEIIIGGGFATETTLSSWGISIDEFGKETKKIIGDVDVKKIIVEPGRFIVGDAGFVYTKIIGTKEAYNQYSTQLIMDAGSNFLIPLDSADYSFHDLNSNEMMENNPSYFIADSWSSFGLLGNTTGLSPKKIGEYILIGNAGAYTYSMASNSGDGFPSYRLMGQNSSKSELLHANHFVQNEKYLNAKYELDKPLLKDILQRLKDLISNKEIKILDVGCGVGHYLNHLIDNGFHEKFKKIQYYGVDLSSEMILLAKNKWKDIKFKNINISFVQGNAYDLSSATKITNFDLVSGLSLMEYLVNDSAIHQMVHLAKSGGIIHFPINYDGITQFEPTFDRELEERIINVFNEQLIPDPFCGRELYNKMALENLEIIDFRVDDWVIIPKLHSINGQEYSNNQEFFLETIIEAINKLKPNDGFSEIEKNEWINLRQSQLRKRELIFICRQCSILARK